MRGKISSSSWADTQIIPCLFMCFFIPISSLIMLIIFSFHPCNQLTVVPARFFRHLIFLPLHVCFFLSFLPFHLSSFSPFLLPFTRSLFHPFCFLKCASDLYVSPVNCSPTPSPFNWPVPLMFINLILLFSTLLTL